VRAVRDGRDQRGGEDADNDKNAARDAYTVSLRRAWVSDVPAWFSEKPYGSKIWFIKADRALKKPT
jgi:hypothetical protein